MRNALRTLCLSLAVALFCAGLFRPDPTRSLAVVLLALVVLIIPRRPT